MSGVNERFGVLIRPTGRFETVQLGFDGDGAPILDALTDYFDGQIEWARTSDGYAYITREGAFDDGCPKNEAATWFASISLFGDVIVIPKKNRGAVRVVWSMADAYRRKVWMRTQWEQECDYRAHPERYSFKNKKNAARA